MHLSIIFRINKKKFHPNFSDLGNKLLFNISKLLSTVYSSDEFLQIFLNFQRTLYTNVYDNITRFCINIYNLFDIYLFDVDGTKKRS